MKKFKNSKINIITPIIPFANCIGKVGQVTNHTGFIPLLWELQSLVQSSRDLNPASKLIWFYLYKRVYESGGTNALISLKDISDKFKLDKGSTSRCFIKLEKHGFIKRKKVMVENDEALKTNKSMYEIRLTDPTNGEIIELHIDHMYEIGVGINDEIRKKVDSLDLSKLNI
jgi:hypothetical protein